MDAVTAFILGLLIGMFLICLLLFLGGHDIT